MKLMNPCLFSLFLLLVIRSEFALGQSITVLSSGEDARICTFAAEAAAMAMVSSRDDVEACTRAIEYGRMKVRDVAGTLVNRGIILAAQEDYQEALDDYNRSMELSPELAEPYVGRGNLLFLADRLELAVADYDRALELNLGRKHIAYFNRGMAYEKLGRTNEAEADYTEALKLEPDWSLAKERLAQLAARQE